MCASGVCVASCPTGQTDCGGACATLDTDPFHCGACGAGCPAGNLCVGGACVPNCTPSESICSGAARGGVAEARLPQEAAVGMYEDVDSEKEEGPRGEEARRRSSSGA